ncbi:MAG: ABC transporter ATP-binding protein [Acutalibacteraceae bacterium]|nr:ABC transporter ATP-binding protein [Acutalibacteraceae bacterium]
MFKRFISYYKPHKLTFTLDMLASFAMSVIAIFYPMITRKMLNELIPQERYREIVIYGLCLLLVYLLRMGLSYFVQYQGHMMGVKMQEQMRSDLFAHIEKLPISFFDNNETGKIMTRMTSDLFDVVELAHHGPENIIITTASVVISFAYLMSINIPLSLILLVCVPMLIIISATLRKKMRTAFKKRRESNAVINAALESSISGIRVTKAFTNADKEIEKFSGGNVQFVENSRAAYKAMGQFHSQTTFITDIFNVILLIAGGFFLFNGEIKEFGDYSAFIVSINLFINPVNTLIRFMESFQDGVTGFERFTEILDTPIEQDKPDAVDMPKVQGEIEFRNVTYGYGDGDNVLKNISFKIKKGTTYALVGPSGGGKTTICHLIPRFYDIHNGNILIDGIDTSSVTLNSLRKNIGIVQQDVYLFNSSIKDNILYGRLDTTDQDVIKAAKQANIHDYIMSLPNGYNTVIGERGVKLSGGQKQRLSIARVFLKNPPILILDEATSALDNATEIMIQQSLDELCKGRTTLVVAHRLSTIKNADKIAVVSGGQICEEGSHEELMAQGGMYAELYNQQFRR